MKNKTNNRLCFRKSEIHSISWGKILNSGAYTYAYTFPSLCKNEWSTFNGDVIWNDNVRCMVHILIYIPYLNADTWMCFQFGLFQYIRVSTHWGRVTHICVGKLTIIDSDNGLSPERRQTIIWTNAGILLTGPLWTNFSEILIEIQTFSLKKIRLKMSSAKCC